MRRFPTYLSYSELEYLAMLLEEDAERKGFHERASLERMRNRLTRTMETIMADEAMEPENWGGA